MKFHEAYSAVNQLADNYISKDMVLGILDSLVEDYAGDYYTSNKRVYRLVKSRNRKTYRRFMHDVQALRDKDPETHKVSTREWAQLYFGYKEIIYRKED